MAFRWAVYRFLNRHVLPRWGWALRKASPEGDNHAISHRDRLIGAVVADLALWATGARLDASRVPALVAEFLDLYPRRPVRDNAGGSGFNASLSLFVAARLIGPATIVECGTFQGHSAWLFAEACPAARVVSFDIEHDNLTLRHARVEYRLGDWSDDALDGIDPASALLFFDDHVSHARRLREAHGRGFRLALFDDDLPVHALHATGLPPAPTLSMLHDDALAAGETVVWRRRMREHRLTVTPEDLAARALVSSRHAMPDLGWTTGYPANQGLVLVRLAPQAQHSSPLSSVRP